MHVEPPVHPVGSRIPALFFSQVTNRPHGRRTRARLVNLSIPHHVPILVNQFCGTPPPIYRFDAPDMFVSIARKTISRLEKKADQKVYVDALQTSCRDHADADRRRHREPSPTLPPGLGWSRSITRAPGCAAASRKNGSVLKIHGAVGLAGQVGRGAVPAADCARMPTPSDGFARRNGAAHPRRGVGHARYRHHDKPSWRGNCSAIGA